MYIIFKRRDNQDNAIIWRKAWADVCNQYLEHDKKIDHRSYAEQGIEMLPTIHEGYMARKIESDGGISERCEINREIRQKNNLIREIIDEIKSITHQITELTQQKGEEINERFANLFKRQHRSGEDSKTERADPNRKRGVEESELQSFIANLDSQRQTAEFDRQRSETERKNREDERKRQDRARKQEIEREKRESKAREISSRARSRDEGPEL